jgi:hypothetical protein
MKQVFLYWLKLISGRHISAQKSMLFKYCKYYRTKKTDLISLRWRGKNGNKHLTLLFLYEAKKLGGRCMRYIYIDS